LAGIKYKLHEQIEQSVTCQFYLNETVTR